MIRIDYHNSLHYFKNVRRNHAIEDHREVSDDDTEKDP